MKRSLQDQANDPALWEVLKHKFEKSSTANTSCRDNDIHSQRHDDHQEDDAPPEGEKRVKKHKASKSLKFAREETVIDEDKVIPKDETPELITKLQNVDKHVPTIFDRARIEVILNDMSIMLKSMDKSKITRKPSKTGKHEHEKRKSTREAKDLKPKVKLVYFLASFSSLAKEINTLDEGKHTRLMDFGSLMHSTKLDYAVHPKE
ncbi:hypothetical protein Tco_1475603 [Tanacetum coccineum]